MNLAPGVPLPANFVLLVNLHMEVHDGSCWRLLIIQSHRPVDHTDAFAVCGADHQRMPDRPQNGERNVNVVPTCQLGRGGEPEIA